MRLLLQPALEGLKVGHDLIHADDEVDLAALPGGGPVLRRFLDRREPLAHLVRLGADRFDVGLHVD
jgi:hypothetical protein